MTVEYYQAKVYDDDPKPTSEINIVIVVGIIFLLLVVVAYLLFFPSGSRYGGSL